MGRGHGFGISRSSVFTRPFYKWLYKHLKSFGYRIKLLRTETIIESTSKNEFHKDLCYFGDQSTQRLQGKNI